MARLKGGVTYKTRTISARLNDEEYNLIKLAASVYAEGNMSKYLIYAALNFEPQYDDLEAPEIDELLKSIKQEHITRKLNKGRL